MSKIIVIDNCDDCPKSSISLANYNKFCNSDFDKPCPRLGIPDWCPLRPLPERKAEMDYLAAGWNLCLDTIEEDE